MRHARPERIERPGSGVAADPGLSEAGRRQAEALAARLRAEVDAGRPLDAVWTSPLRRARETAGPLGAALGLDVEVGDDLAEFDRHADSYVPLEDLKAAGDPRWRAGPADPEAFRRSAVAAVEAVVAAHPRQRVVLVGHGGVINAYTGWVLGQRELLFFWPEYTSISRVLAAGDGRRGIGSLNEAGHLLVPAP